MTSSRQTRRAALPGRSRVLGFPLRWLDIPWLGGIRVAPWFLLATVLIIVVAAVGAGWVQGHPDRLDYATRAFRINGTQAQLTFDVEKSPNAVAQCTVRARSRDDQVVGRRTDIVVGPTTDGRRVTTVKVTLTTSREANVVEVEDCQITRPG
ncbi:MULTISPECIES: DUF4307 domain-containing protein [unclassified Frankia]|uniref:DUF4307 domain-containing protein n=1 Tax=unclassified Frankia TaxID=2632575 RepID=UPI002AD41CA7|nr:MULTISPECIES: DUF4307 domain-containing protein [unclassified Frankia]